MKFSSKITRAASRQQIRVGLSRHSPSPTGALKYLLPLVYLCRIFLLVLWLGICVEVDVDRINILTPPPFLPIFFVPTHNPLFNTSDSYLK